MSIEDKTFYALKLMVDQNKTNSTSIISYRIRISDSEKGGQYRQLQAISSFKKQQGNIRKSNDCWYMLDSAEVMLSPNWKLEYEKAYNITIPEVECSSIKDFFSKIGWNQKSKKFK